MLINPNHPSWEDCYATSHLNSPFAHISQHQFGAALWLICCTKLRHRLSFVSTSRSHIHSKYYSNSLVAAHGEYPAAVLDCQLHPHPPWLCVGTHHDKEPTKKFKKIWRQLDLTTWPGNPVETAISLCQSKEVIAIWKFNKRTFTGWKIGQASWSNAWKESGRDRNSDPTLIMVWNTEIEFKVIFNENVLCEGTGVYFCRKMTVTVPWAQSHLHFPALPLMYRN